MPFEFNKKEIPGVFLIESRVFNDPRGYFFEGFKQSEFIKNGLNENFCQSNFSLSKKAVLRGLHFQLNPNAQGKLVQCIKGSIFDVIVDIRKGSPCFGKWLSFNLSFQKKEFLYCPPGFAHGFQALEDDTLVMYLCTKEYAPEAEAGIIWNDSELNIPWPLKDPVITEKDLEFPCLKNQKGNFTFIGK